jgi:hypothetical protein
MFKTSSPTYIEFIQEAILRFISYTYSYEAEAILALTVTLVVSGTAAFVIIFKPINLC